MSCRGSLGETTGSNAGSNEDATCRLGGVAEQYCRYNDRHYRSIGQVLVGGKGETASNTADNPQAKVLVAKQVTLQVITLQPSAGSSTGKTAWCSFCCRQCWRRICWKCCQGAGLTKAAGAAGSAGCSLGGAVGASYTGRIRQCKAAQVLLGELEL